MAVMFHLTHSTPEVSSLLAPPLAGDHQAWGWQEHSVTQDQTLQTMVETLRPVETQFFFMVR